MPTCSECNKKVILTYRCHYCGEQFCEEHRLPERHRCVGIEAAKRGARIGGVYATEGGRPEFDAWLDSTKSERFVLEGHTFEKTLNGDLRIDGGRFSREEAREVAEMLSSRNPLVKFNAALAIWGRNGKIYTALLVAVVLLLLIVLITLEA